MFAYKRTPTVIQMEAIECGAAALAIILGYYGRYVSLEELRFRCGVSRDGVNAYNIVQAAKYYGLEATGYKVDAKHIDEVNLPAILFWNNNHFIVLEEITNDFVYINDPAIGPRTIFLDEFLRCYSHVALEMKPGPSFQKGGKPPSIISSIKERISPFIGSIAFLFFVQICIILLGLVIPVASQIFIDKILGEKELSWKWEFLGILTGTMVLMGVLTWIRGIFLSMFQIRMNIRLSTQFLWHILQLPMSFFTQRFGGEIINRNNLNSQISETLAGQIVITIINVLLISVYAVIMYQYDALITVLAILTALGNLAILYYVSRKRSNAYALFQQEQAKTIGVSLDAIQHIETIKSSCSDNFIFSRIAGLYTQNINALQDLGKRDAWLFSLSSLSQQLATVFVLGIGSWRVMHGHLTIGMLVGFQLLLTSLLKPFNQLVEFGARMQTFQTDINRLDDVLKNPIDPLLEEHQSVDTTLNGFQGSFEMKDISFGYSPLGPPLLDHFHMSLSKGKWIALVGSIGAGKSTVAKLACGLYMPWNGEILYDGRKKREYSREGLMHSIGYIDQDIVLFSGTIRDNITLWNSEIPEEQIVQASKDACIHDEIIVRPGAYQFHLTENGNNFSAGQRQRIEIARALLLNPTFLILDEATSALDSDTERKIIANIRNRGCMCLIIAHRLSSVTHCDEIIVLDKGHVVQRGTHDHLLAMPGLYQKLNMAEEGNI